MGVCPITLTKFVGTFSLGLLTGTSYTLAHLTLPSLALLPSATHASRTLSALQVASTRETLTLASISSLSLITAYTLASARNKHPYLLWTALVAFLGGQGVEYYFNGLQRFPSFAFPLWFRSKKPASAINNKDDDAAVTRGRKTVTGAGTMSESEYVSVGRETSSVGSSEEEKDFVAVNGEKVEMEMARERKIQMVRTVVSGVGFMMGVVGIWGDGA